LTSPSPKLGPGPLPPPRPTFAMASENMATVVALLDNLPAPSTDGVDSVYHQLKDILVIAAEQQTKSSLQWWAEVSISSLGRSKASRQGTASKLPVDGTASSPTPTPTCLWLSHLSECPEPEACHQAHRGEEGHVLSTACVTHTTVSTAIRKGTASAPKG
jgi:hypothetical protein